MADEMELKPIPINQLPAATKLEKSMLFPVEQDGVAKKVSGEQLVELSIGPAGPEGPAGADGISPTVSFSAIDGGNRMTVTDADGTKSVDVMNGKDGKDGEQGPAGLAGKDATINGENAIELVEGENVKIKQDGRRVIISAESGTNFDTNETLDMQDGVLGVTNPVNGVISQEDFDALPPEKQNHGVYVIRGKDQPLAGVEIEEYDTTVDGCDWHVRKWSNGYVEFIGEKTYPSIPCNSPWGSLYITDQTEGPLYPFTLVKVYETTASLESSNYDGIPFFRYNYNKNDNLTAAISFRLFRPNVATITDVIMTYRISGRWK